MSGRVAGKVAFITGAARSQGRCHAIRLAEEGADIIAVDICETIPEVAPFYAGADRRGSRRDGRQVEALDRRIVATQADVRDFDALKAAFEDGLAQLGRIDIVSANAGIFIFGNRARTSPTRSGTSSTMSTPRACGTRARPSYRRSSSRARVGRSC